MMMMMMVMMSEHKMLFRLKTIKMFSENMSEKEVDVRKNEISTHEHTSSLNSRFILLHFACLQGPSFLVISTFRGDLDPEVWTGP